VGDFIRVILPRTIDPLNDVHRSETLIEERPCRESASTIENEENSDNRKIIKHQQREAQLWVL
jgi:hypothetical protein